MGREGCIVRVDFVQQNLCLVVAGQQDFELQRPGLIRQTSGSVGHQERQDALKLPGCDFEVSNNGDLGQLYASSSIPRTSSVNATTVAAHGTQS
jgi:hypothetical protein